MDRRKTISQVTSREVDRVTLLDGYLHASQRKAVYVPFFIPAILTYSPDDTTGTAYPTPDYGHPLPTTEEEGRPSPKMNGMSTMQNGVLSVQKPTPATDSLMFDLYNASEMEYMYSIRLPSNGKRALYGYGTGTVAALRDTSAIIYEISLPRK